MILENIIFVHVVLKIAGPQPRYIYYFFSLF